MNGFSDDKRIQHLLVLMRRKGIKEVFVCSGSRNIPIVQSLASSYEFTLHSVLDERSAAFQALGLAQMQQAPVAIVCTSGSAVLNMLPALMEGFMTSGPILVLSADRPQSFVGQNRSQTIDQYSPLKACVAHQVALPLLSSIDDKEALLLSDRTINEALLALEVSAKPVQINIPFAEPFFNFECEDLPTSVRSIQYIKTFSASFSLQKTYASSSNDALIEQLGGDFEAIESKALPLSPQRLLVVVGYLTAPLSPLWRDLLYHLSLHGATIYSELEGLPFAQQYWQSEDTLALLKDKGAFQGVLSLGGDVISKPLRQLLMKHVPLFHISLQSSSQVIDTFGVLTHIWPIALSEAGVILKDFFKLEVTTKADSSALNTFSKGETALSTPSRLRLDPQKNNISAPFAGDSTTEMLHCLLHYVGLEDVLHLGNSATVRRALKHGFLGKAYCNRGCSGIDGIVSTAVGQAIASHHTLVWTVLGDLSLFYDRPMGVREALPSNLTLVVLNDQGGSIFQDISGYEGCINAYPYISMPHKKGIEAVAKAMDCDFVSVQTRQEFEAALKARVETLAPIKTPALGFKAPIHPQIIEIKIH